MTALRAQMNPHFIFNCLNSIKLYTLENDSATASEYLTKFSQLIRLVLENSRSEKVTLQKELETLKLYIDMEAMRFKDKVRYCINVDERIDAGYIEIPPLLIQPYVENAIWHGLMHKKEGGLIKIDVGMAYEHLLHVEISDDGIGRGKAMEYKSKSVTRQKSFGLKMTSERMGIINELYQTKTFIKIIDEKDAINNSCGTKVIIEIPV
jgi:LytS/YehU family sensor histidine kinase